MDLTPEESLDLLADSHFPQTEDLPLEDDPAFLDFDIKVAGDFEVPVLEWLSMATARASINHFLPNMVAGPDRVNPRMLQNIPNCLLAQLIRV